MKARSLLLLVGTAFVLATMAASARANFIDTTWTITGFTGEAWFVDAESLTGKTQYFEKGYAEGVFYACDFGGQSSNYTSYATADFLANPEFALFAPLADEIGKDSATVYVHRITCEGGGDPEKRRALYPFVTNETRKAAWYLFEGGVFTLKAAD